NELQGLYALMYTHLDNRVTGLRPALELIHQLVMSSTGNPLLALSLLDRLEAFGALVTRGNELALKSTADVVGLPAGLVAVLASRISSVSNPCRTLLTRAAFY